MGNASGNEQPNRAPRGPSVSGWPGGGASVEASGSGVKSLSANNAARLSADSGSVGSGMPGAAAPRWLGKKVGRFRLLALLGQGAMGRVFRAEDTMMGRHVALKVLPRAVKNGSVKVGPEMLIREARAAAAIEHPNAVQIFEVNQAGDVCYVAMELLEGGNLRDLVRAAGPMDLTRACLVCAEAAEALAAAHVAGVIHRDVKPANLMLSRPGRCKVVDFGLARLDEAGQGGARAADNSSSENVGTPQFIAPEILSGTPASAASDVYSLGGTLFYLVTGRPPYEAKSARDLLRMHMDAPVPDLRSYRPDASRALADALGKALAKRPAERWGSMEQFARVLRVHSIPTPAAESAGANMPLPTPGYFPPAAPAAPSPSVAGRAARPASPVAPPLPEAELSVEIRRIRPRLVLPAWAWWAGAGALVAAAGIVLCIAVSKTPSKDLATSSGQQGPSAPMPSTPAQTPTATPAAAILSPAAPAQTPVPPQPQPSALTATPPVTVLPHVPGASLKLGDFEAESDIGEVKTPGLVNFDAPRHNYTVTGDGFDIYYKNDSGHFVWRKMSGNLTIKAAVRFVGSSPARFRKAALIVRQSLEPTSPFVDILMHGEGSIVVQDRLEAGQLAEQHMTDLTDTTLWLVRRGDHFVGYVSSPGGEPRPTLEVTLPMKDPVYVGLAVTARDGPDRPIPKPETAVFTGVEIDPAARLTERPVP